MDNKIKVELSDDLVQAINANVADAIKSALAGLKEDAHSSQYLNYKEAAEYLGISYSTLRLWINQDPNFPMKIVNGSTRFKKTELDKYMEM